MKMQGIVKWYKSNKGYGYIIGIDEDTYFFDRLNIIGKDILLESGDRVLFVPHYETMDYATEIEKLDNYE